MRQAAPAVLRCPPQPSNGGRASALEMRACSDDCSLKFVTCKRQICTCSFASEFFEVYRLRRLCAVGRVGRPPEALGGRERVGLTLPLCATAARPHQKIPLLHHRTDARSRATRRYGRLRRRMCEFYLSVICVQPAWRLLPCALASQLSRRVKGQATESAVARICSTSKPKPPNALCLPARPAKQMLHPVQDRVLRVSCACQRAVVAPGGPGNVPLTGHMVCPCSESPGRRARAAQFPSASTRPRRITAAGTHLRVGVHQMTDHVSDLQPAQWRVNTVARDAGVSARGLARIG